MKYQENAAMIFDDSRETVLSNLEQYIRGGCYPFCVKPAYFRELEDFWEPDRRELERSMAQKGMSCVALCYNNNVDAGRSGLNRRVHNGELLRRITMRYGQNSTAFMKDVGLDKGNSLTAVMYGTTYNPAIRDMGKNAAGYCMWGEKNVLVLYAAALSPMSSLHNFYHETAHALQRKLKLGEREDKVVAMLEKRVRNANGTVQQAARKAFEGEKRYVNYLGEAHAELFGAAMMLLRTRTEREYQSARQFLVRQAANRMHQGRGKEAADYNYYRPLLKMLEQFDTLGRRGRAEFGKVSGRFSLDKVALFTHNIVRENAMSRDEFRVFSTSVEPLEQLQQKQGQPGYGWLGEAFGSAAVVQMSADELNLQALGNRLAAAKSQRQIYDAFREFRDVVPETAPLYEVYKQHNHQGRLYDKLRKTEEILGVDRLFGKFAEKRRTLGAKIMNRISGGR